MAQVDSENSIAMPVDSTRRRFLSAAAAGAVATLASTIGEPGAAAPAADPIYAAIENHRQSYAAMQAVFAEHKRAHDLADAKVGPSHIMVPSMVEPGATVEAICWWDIERVVPREQYPDLYAHHNRLLDERRAARAAIIEPLIGDEDETTDEVCGPELEALYEFAGTVPTTLASLLAMIIYAGECSENNAEAFTDSDSPLIEHLAASRQGAAGAVMSSIIEFPVADRPITENEIAKLHSEAFRDLEKWDL
jgi:hypothetical protein